jgi:ABC-type multidrug transport system fused ATPase/permease subunit
VSSLRPRDNLFGWFTSVVEASIKLLTVFLPCGRVFAQLELDFNSVERIGEYLVLPQEAPAIIANARPPAHWPSRTGGITVDHLVMRYADGLPDVLRDLSFEVRPREKVGVVGRTGSGKTSLALSLLRAIEPSGGRLM